MKIFTFSLKVLTFLCAGMLAGMVSLNAHAQQAESPTNARRYTAIIEDTQQFKNQGISFLSWDDPVVIVESVGDFQRTTIRGHVNSKIQHLYFNGSEVKLDETNGFTVSHEFRQEVKTFNMRVIDGDSKSYFSQYRIRAADFRQEPKSTSKSLFRFSAGAGITSLSYRQQRIAPFSQLALTIKGSASHPIWQNKLEVGVSGFYNVIGFNSTSPRDFKMRYLGINARVGYALIPAPSALKVNLNLGIYYNTSFSDIGFGNMMGPQLYPEMSYQFNNGHSVHAYGKISPAFSNTYSISFTENREVAAGVHYSFPINASNRLTVGIDVSQLQLSVEPNWGITNTYSLSGGVSF